MQESLAFYIHQNFRLLIDDYKFHVESELNNGQFYSIEFSSDIIKIKVEKYFREFYVSISKVSVANSGINLFNLLEFLKQGETNIPKSNYFRSENDLDKCYKKQLHHLTSVIYQNYNLIIEFSKTILRKILLILKSIGRKNILNFISRPDAENV